MTGIRILAALVALAVGTNLALAQQDQVYRRGGGKTEVGVINGMTKTEIVIAVNGSDTKIPANEITRITCEGEPREMAQVRTDIVANNYGSALEDLKKINLKQVERDVAKQEVEFYKAFCAAKIAMSEGGNKEEAEAGLKDFVTKYKDSFHYFTVAQLAGDVAASAGNFQKAVQYYGVVESRAPWADVNLRARVELGRALMGLQKYDEALTKFDAVIADPAKTAETEPLKQMAKVGRAACLGEAGKTKEAIDLIAGKDGVIIGTDVKNTALMARAYNALGTAYFKSGQKKEAKLAFMRTDLLFFSEADAHAEALYYLAKIFTEEKKADRAGQASATLKARYPGSVWAGK
jgi:tetratricopeptide (TPR) repeat protein